MSTGKKINFIKGNNGQVVYAHGDSFIIEIDENTGKPYSANIPTEKFSSNQKPWAPYFSADNFPATHMDKLNKLSVGKPAINFNADCHYGAGGMWFKREVTESKKLQKVPVISDEWEEFNDRVDFEMGLSQTIENLEYWYWSVVLFNTNLAGTQILKMTPLDTYYCRREIRKNGVSKNIYFSYLFPNAEPSEYKSYPVYDPSVPREKQTEFCVVLFYQTPGMIYYPLPDYHAVFENGWVDVAIAVPEIINVIYQNAASFKYILHVPKAYFTALYPDWDEKPEQQAARIQTLYNDVKERLTGKENSHKMIMSIFAEMDGKETPGLRVEAIKDYLDRTADLPNNAAANSEILFSLGVDPSSIGLGIPGGKNLSGSGSDKREARDNKQASQYRSRLVSQYLAKFCRDFQNMQSLKGARWYFLDEDTSQTLDENPTGSQTKVGGA